MESPTFTSSVHYQDPKAAVAWLERAFGFEITMAIEGAAGGSGDVPLRDERPWARAHHDRRAVGRMGEEPQKTWAAPTRRVSTSCSKETSTRIARRARAAGASIVAEPVDEFYGDRKYRAADLEGHRVELLGARARCVARGGGSGPRPADHRQELAVRPRAQRIDDAFAALADPARRRAVELLVRRPQRARRARPCAPGLPLGDEQAPAHLARSRLW